MWENIKSRHTTVGVTTKTQPFEKCKNHFSNLSKHSFRAVLHTYVRYFWSIHLSRIDISSFFVLSMYLSFYSPTQSSNTFHPLHYSFHLNETAQMNAELGGRVRDQPFTKHNAYELLFKPITFVWIKIVKNPKLMKSWPMPVILYELTIAGWFQRRWISHEKYHEQKCF